jgi:hypothetical protein
LNLGWNHSYPNLFCGFINNFAQVNTHTKRVFPQICSSSPISSHYILCGVHTVKTWLLTMEHLVQCLVTSEDSWHMK